MKCLFKNKKILFLIIILLIIISINITSPIGLEIFSPNDDFFDSSRIVVGPYSQKPQDNSIIILWQTDIKTSINEVHWGTTPDCENVVSELMKNKIGPGILHRVKITGLLESTKYYYKVVSDGIESEIFNFYTVCNKNDRIEFVAYGDSRGVWDNWKNASIIAQSIEKHNPNFVIHTGDLVKNGINETQWLDFFSISDFVHNSTLIPVLGNHEYYGSPFFDYFILPNNEKWFSFDYGSIHFVGLDSNFGSAFRIQQFFWLIFDLGINEKPFTCVYFHNPVYSSGAHGSTFYLQLIWKPIFDYFNVDIVFNGHDHNYERGKIKNTNYIVTGGGGAPLREVGKSWWTIHSEKAFHYCYISSNSSELTFQAIKFDGNVIDTFTIKK